MTETEENRPLLRRPMELDLSKPLCHVCGKKLIRNTDCEKEWCVNPECQVKGVKFTIPYALYGGKSVEEDDATRISREAQLKAEELSRGGP